MGWFSGTWGRRERWFLEGYCRAALLPRALWESHRKTLCDSDKQAFNAFEASLKDRFASGGTLILHGDDDNVFASLVVKASAVLSKNSFWLDLGEFQEALIERRAYDGQRTFGEWAGEVDALFLTGCSAKGLDHKFFGATEMVALANRRQQELGLTVFSVPSFVSVPSLFEGCRNRVSLSLGKAPLSSASSTNGGIPLI